MNQHRRTTITTRILTFCAAAGLLMAHGGFDHVIGTVAKTDGSTLTVKTAKGDVNVKLTDKTEITQNDQKFNAADLKPGLRVVVDVPEGSKDMTAHSVKVGVSPAHAASEHH